MCCILFMHCIFVDALKNIIVEKIISLDLVAPRAGSPANRRHRTSPLSSGTLRLHALVRRRTDVITHHSPLGSPYSLSRACSRATWLESSSRFILNNKCHFAKHFAKKSLICYRDVRSTCPLLTKTFSFCSMAII